MTVFMHSLSCIKTVIALIKRGGGHSPRNTNQKLRIDDNNNSAKYSLIWSTCLGVDENLATLVHKNRFYALCGLHKNRHRPN